MRVKENKNVHKAKIYVKRKIVNIADEKNIPHFICR